MADTHIVTSEQETGSDGILGDHGNKGSMKNESSINGEDTVSEHSNASSCGELNTSHNKAQFNESASLSDSNSRASDVQAQIRQKLKGLSPVKRRLDSNASDTKRCKQRNRISQMISGSSFRSKRELFTKLFILNRGLPSDEQLITDFSCAWQKDILVHGRLYLSQNWMCFYANIIGWESLATINWSDITAITKEKTARVIPNAIQVNTNTEKYFFTSFVSRENSYRSLFRIWQNALMGQPTSPQHLRSLCKRIRGQTGPKDEVDHPISNDHDQDEAEETGDEVTENDTGQDDDHSYPPSEVSQEIGQEQGALSMEGQEQASGSTKISVIPPSPTTSETHGNDDALESPDMPPTSGLPQFRIGPKDGEDKDDSLPPRPISPLARRAEHFMNFARRKKPDKKRAKKKVSNRTLMQMASVTLPVPDLDPGESTEMEEEGSLSSEDDQGDVLCPCHDNHPGKQYIVEDYNFDIDALYEHLFAADSDLMKNLYKERKMFDFSCGPFERLEEGGSSRIIKYTLTLNYSIGPKHSPTTMKQIFSKDNKPGSFYVIDTEVRNQGIPYSESFYVHNRYCLTRLYGNRSRMRIHGRIVQTKTVMGFMKNIIFRNADEALLDYCNHLGLNLRQRSDLLPSDPRRKPSPIVTKESKEEIKFGDAASKHSVHRPTESSSSPISPPETKIQKSIVSSLVSVPMPGLTTLLLLMLLCLLSMNTYLFYRLYKLESLARADSLCGQRNLPASHEEWHRLMQHQKYAYGVEVKRLKDVIGGTAQLVKQVERSISELYKELEESQASSETDGTNYLRFREKRYSPPPEP